MQTTPNADDSECRQLKVQTTGNAGDWKCCQLQMQTAQNVRTQTTHTQTIGHISIFNRVTYADLSGPGATTSNSNSPISTFHKISDGFAAFISCNEIFVLWSRCIAFLYHSSNNCCSPIHIIDTSGGMAMKIAQVAVTKTLSAWEQTKHHHWDQKTPNAVLLQMQTTQNADNSKCCRLQMQTTQNADDSAFRIP